MSKDLAMKENERHLQDVQWDLHEVEELKPLEFTEINNVDLFGIEPVKAEEMINGLSTTLAERQVLKDAYADVITLEITTENLPTFKELRLKIMKNRTQGLTKWKEKEKAFYIAGGNFIQAIYNKEVAVNEEMELKLMEAEKFFENQEKERLALLKKEREELLQPFVDNLPGGLEDLDQDVFDSFLETKKKAYADKLEAERLEAERLENERIAREKEIESQRLENLRLKEEAEIRDKAIEQERKEAEAKQKAIQEEADKKAREEKAKQAAILKAEKEAKAKIEAELQAKKDAEIKAENERIEKEKAEKAEADKLAKAPVKKQLSVWVESFNIPVVGVENEATKEIKEKFEAFKKWSLSQVDNL